MSPSSSRRRRRSSSDSPSDSSSDSLSTASCVSAASAEPAESAGAAVSAASAAGASVPWCACRAAVSSADDGSVMVSFIQGPPGMQGWTTRERPCSRAVRSLLPLLLALVQGGALRRGHREVTGLLLRPAPLLGGLGAGLAGALQLLLVGELLAALVLRGGLDADLPLGLGIGLRDLLRRGEVQRLQTLPLALGVDALLALLLRVGAGGGGRADDDVL